MTTALGRHRTRGGAIGSAPVKTSNAPANVPPAKKTAMVPARTAAPAPAQKLPNFPTAMLSPAMVRAMIPMLESQLKGALEKLNPPDRVKAAALELVESVKEWGAELEAKNVTPASEAGKENA